MKTIKKIHEIVMYVIKKMNKDKVRYHCYITTKYKGPAHKQCNKISRKFPIIFHNLEGYDGI